MQLEKSQMLNKQVILIVLFLFGRLDGRQKTCQSVSGYGQACVDVDQIEKKNAFEAYYVKSIFDIVCRCLLTVL